MNKHYFISGIDTDCGKTYITGKIAAQLLAQGEQVITTKLIQTGCEGISEDILSHRDSMGLGPLPEDVAGDTCPLVFKFPASPHLAAEMENREVDLTHVKQRTAKLKQHYDICLTEGAGGLLVPIKRNYFTVDYIAENQLPVILVTSSKLGSLNHSLLSLELCRQRGVHLHTVVYNQLPQSDPFIAADSFTYIKDYLANHWPQVQYLHSHSLENIRL